jgi:hypothetical protein
MSVLIVIAMVAALIAVWVWLWPRSWFAYWERMADNPRYAPFPPVDPFAFFRSIPAFILALLLFFPTGLLLSLPFGGPDAKPSSGIVLLILGVALLPFVLSVTQVFVAWPRFLVPPNARREADLEEQSYVHDHPLVAVVVVLLILAVAAVSIWSKHR